MHGEKTQVFDQSNRSVVQKYTVRTAKSVRIQTHSIGRHVSNWNHGWNHDYEIPVATQYPVVSRLLNRHSMKASRDAIFHNVLAQNVLLDVHSFRTTTRHNTNEHTLNQNNSRLYTQQQNYIS